LVNHAGADATLRCAARRIRAVAFILGKTRRVVVNALLRAGIIFTSARLCRNPALMCATIELAAWDWGCRVQRKVFRVEAMMTGKRPVADAYAEHRRAMAEAQARAPVAAPARADDGDPARILKAELILIQNTLARHKRDLGDLIGFGDERHMSRATDELGAAIDGMETATQKILKSVEVIDDSAKALTASLKDDYKRGLAQDIQDNVMRIYESCNFQDIAGQRIGKVMVTLAAIEDQVSDMLARCHGIPAAKAQARATVPAERDLLNGPKLDGDAGHASQRDIDQMFN
jgi:chemotaxis protein CheZ